MRTLWLILTVTFAGEAYAQEFKLPAGREKEFQVATTRLYFGYQCDQRLDMPEMYADAKAIFSKLLSDVDAPDELASKVIEKLTSEPQQKEEGSFSLFNPKMCGEIAKALREQARGLD